MTASTKSVAEAWFDGLDRADYASAIALLHPDIVWINVPQIKDGSDVIPWIGTARGLDEVTQQFTKRDGVCEVKEFKSVGLFVKVILLLAWFAIKQQLSKLISLLKSSLLLG